MAEERRAGERRDPGSPRALKDILAGLVFIVFGLGFAFGATTYEIGSPVRMGPGYLPLGLGGVLVVLGLAIIVKGFLDGDTEPIGSVPWRAMAFLIVAIVGFGLTVRGLGLVPATALAAALSALASRRATPISVVAITVGLTVVCVLVFVVVLSLRIPLFGPVLRFD